MSKQKIELLVFSLFFLVLYSCDGNRSSHKTATAITVKTEKVKLSTDSIPLSVTANIEGNKTVRLGFMVAGKINYIAANEGEEIKKGELLASLDPENYQIAEEIAGAQLDQTKDEYKRLSELYRRHSLSESDYSAITNKLKAAKAQHHLQVKNLQDTKLYAPIHGVLLKKGVESGEIIDKGIQLFALSDIYTVKAVAAVPENELKNIHIGQKAKVHVAALDSTFSGEIIEIGTLADPESRTFDVKVKVKNPHLLIRPGMTAEVLFSPVHPAKGITIPIQSVLHDPDNSTWVYVIDPKKQKAFKREVALGKIIGNQVLISSGLSSDESIVTAGQYRLSNGSSVIIQ